MKGKTQLPQLPVLVVFEVGDDVDTGDGDGVGDGDGDGVDEVAGGKEDPPAYGGQVLRSGICWFSHSVK